MKDKRLIIETSSSTKDSLSKILYSQHKSLTEWFYDKVEESVLSPQDELLSTSFKRISPLSIRHLEELSNKEDIIRKFKSLDWSFTDVNTAYLSHNIHPYPAKYIPQLPNLIIHMLSLPGETIWDPFGGSGTTALEALLLSRQAVSSDINPIAEIIGRAKTISITKLEEDELIRFAEEFVILAQDSESFDRAFSLHSDEIRKTIPIIPNIEKWFHQFVINELGLIKWAILNKLSIRARTVALASFSKIIVKASYQDGETRYASKIRDIEMGATLLLFANDLKTAVTKIKQLSILLRFREAKFVTANLLTDAVVEKNSIDLIVCSPPYPNVTDYHLYHRFRIFWLGFDPKGMATSEIGSHLRHQKERTAINDYLSEMKSCLEKMYNGLRHGRYAVLVLGDCVFEGCTFKTAEMLSKTATELGFECIDIIKRKVHETKRSFISAGRRLKEEKFLILRKPQKSVNIQLLLPPYKLWPYENFIRKQELKNVLGKHLTKTDKDVSNITISSLQVDKLRRLTFTHGFSALDYSKELTWQAVVENGDASQVSNRKDPKYITHGLHPYKGKFYPQLAKSIFNIANLEVGQTLLDPFCGSGTVLLEGLINGYNTYGCDLNPLAIKIANAKTDILKVDINLTQKLLSDFQTRLKSLSVSKNKYPYKGEILKELTSWFPPTVLRKLCNIINLINDIPEKHVADFLEVCLSSIIRDVSQQEPKDLRIRRREIPIVDAPVQELLSKRVDDQLNRLLKYARSAKFSPSYPGNANAFQGDCRSIESFNTLGIGKNSIDAIVTSPPYANALPYIDTDRLSILLLMGKLNNERQEIEKSLVGAREITVKERNDIDEKIKRNEFNTIHSKTAIATIKQIYRINSNASVGFRRKNTAALLYRYYQDISMAFQNFDTICKRKANMFFVIGDNRTTTESTEILIKSGKALSEIGIELGWQLKDKIPITVTQDNRLNNKNGITENDILWFQK